MNWPSKQYNIILADPPWAYRNFSGGKAKGTTTYGSAAHHYPCMDTPSIQGLPIRDIAAKDCWLFLWATFPNIQAALCTINAWGFEYKTVAFTWVKTRGKGWYSGLGFYTNGNAEVCLLARRGRVKRVANNVKQLIVYPVGRHSAKPPEARDRIVQLCGDLPRIELFNREVVTGWDAWGNEA